MSERDLSRLRELMDVLRGRLDSSVEGAGAQEVLRAIYGVNNELGRLARGDSSLRIALTELQLLLNSVTMEVKRRRFPEALASFARAENSLSSIRKDKDARKPQKEFISSAGHGTH